MAHSMFSLVYDNIASWAKANLPPEHIEGFEQAAISAAAVEALGGRPSHQREIQKCLAEIKRIFADQLPGTNDE